MKTLIRLVTNTLAISSPISHKTCLQKEVLLVSILLATNTLDISSRISHKTCLQKEVVVLSIFQPVLLCLKKGYQSTAELCEKTLHLILCCA